MKQFFHGRLLTKEKKNLPRPKELKKILGEQRNNLKKKDLREEKKSFLNNLKKVYSKELVWKIDPNLSLRRYSIVGVGEDGIRESIDKIE